MMTTVLIENIHYWDGTFSLELVKASSDQSSARKPRSQSCVALLEKSSGEG